MEEEMQRRRLLRRPNSSASPAILPDEVMVEIVSWLPVKHVMKLRCLNKFFNTLIFDPYFIQLHLNKSMQNSHLALTYFKNPDCSLVTLSVPCLLQNKFTINSDRYHRLTIWRRVVGSCNGLLLIVTSCPLLGDQSISFWNPAMRTKTKNFTILSDSTLCSNHCFKFAFGYDILTRTYKVVMFYMEVKPSCNLKSVVKVFSLGDNSWRDIQCLPALPLYWSDRSKNNGVHLNGTINWLVVCHYQYVILSLDLSSETYSQLLPPPGFDKLLRYIHRPKIVVLMECLCFCHDFEETHFVIWKMKDFGVQESWIQLFKISYENCFGWESLLPLYLFENGDTLILANDGDNEAFIYNHRDKTVEKIEISNIQWSQAKNYVESLVSTH